MEEKLKSIFKGAGTRQGCPLSLFLFKAVTDASARTLRGRDEGGANRAWRTQSILTSKDMILCIKDSKKLLQKTLTADKHIQQNSRVQNQHTKVSGFPTSNKCTKKEIRDRLPFTMPSKTIKQPVINFTKEVQVLYKKKLATQMWVWGSNADPRACPKGTLPAEPSPQHQPLNSTAFIASN